MLEKLQPNPVIFTNNAPAWAWGFMGVWMLMMLAYTYACFTDTTGETTWMIPLLAVLWIFSARNCYRALSEPRVRVEIAKRRVVTQERYLCSSREDRFAASQLSVPALLEDKDSDGDLYFKCLLRLPDKRSLVVAENGSRDKVEAKREQLLAALARA